MATQSNSPMVSEVSICNQALSWVGQDEITSLDQKGKSAQWCRNNYPFTRNAVLESRMWTFATARETSVTADLDPWSSLFVHPKPLGWYSVYRCYRDVSNPFNYLPARQWRVEGENVLAQESTVYMWGILEVTDTSDFSPLFVQALAARLAADMAVPFTKNRALQADMWALYEAKLEEAAARDGQQGANDYITQRQLTGVRLGGGDIGYF